MKVIFLSPGIHSTEVPKLLQSLGVAVLIASELKEAELILKLHGRSTGLIVGHDEPGVQLNQIIKNHPVWKQVPVILTTSKWSEAECVKHQDSNLGANAYVRTPVDDRDFIHIIDEVLGTRLSHGEGFTYVDELSHLSQDLAGGGFELNLGSGKPHLSTVPSSPQAPSEDDLPSFQVEEASRIFDPNQKEGHSEDPGIDIAIPLEAAGVSEEDLAADYNNSKDTGSEDDFLETMPYLSKRRFSSPLRDAQQPLEDSVVPGGAVHAPSEQTLKSALMMREQDVAALSNQLKHAREHIKNLDKQLKVQKAMNTEFSHLIQEQGRRIQNFEKEKEVAVASARKESEESRFEMKRKIDHIHVMEHEVENATKEMETLKERVRQDIRKIRTREKELENRLEIMKRDSEVLLSSREQKIVELKRKLDLMEFNLDLLQDKLEKEKKVSSGYREKLTKAAQIVRVAGGLLHPNEVMDLAETFEEGKTKERKSSVA